MPYSLYECSKSAKMDEIWDENWGNLSLGQQLERLNKDDQSPIFLKYLPTRGKILEAGCGFGKWVFFLKRKGYDIIGIDFAKEAIKMAKRYDEAIPIEFGDITHIQYSDNYFDAYMSLGVVEHFQDGPFLALKEAKRVLKPNGLILVSVPVFNTIRKITLPIERAFSLLRDSKYLRRLFRKPEYAKKHFIEYRFGIKEFDNILRNAGFQIECKIPFYNHVIGLFNYFLEPLPYLRNELLKNVFAIVSNQLKRINPSLAPHMVMWVGRKS
jgi:SAM-dependent methyltransferase